IESADDFILSQQTHVTSATFTGLLVGGATVGGIQDVVVQIYRVFPKDSDVTRTSGPPTFSTDRVPTRVNSPSDVEVDDGKFSTNGLSFSVNTLSASFTAANSVINGINPKPAQTTMGEGQVTGTEITLNVTFTTPFDLPADHYFIVPQVQVAGSGNWLWLS